MTGPVFHLTRRAALDLRAIHKYSLLQWGQDTADRYVADLYVAISRAAANPDAGRLRQLRSAPFLMVAVRAHFIVYASTPNGIVVLTLLHQVRDIEALIAEMTPAFFREIERLTQANPQ